MDPLAEDLAIMSFKERRSFKDCYLEYCKGHHLQQTSKKLALQTDPTKLQVDADQICLADWEAIFVALQKENLLKELNIISSKRKRDWPSKVIAEDVTTAFAVSSAKGQPAVYTRYVMDKLITSLIKALGRNESQIEKLHIELPVAPGYCLQISKGLAKAEKLNHLSLSGSCIGDEGCQYICDAVKLMPNIRVLDLSECCLGPQAIDKITDLLQCNALIRSSVAWESSFRYRAPSNEISQGLLRLTLNKNQDIGDEGANKIAAVLVDDMGLQAIDLRKCQITNKGVVSLLGTLSRNRTLKIMDLRENKACGYMMHAIKKALLSPERAANSKTNVKWLPLDPDYIADGQENS